MAKMGFEHSITSVRWTLVWSWLDSTNTLISATRKCNKSLLLRHKNFTLSSGVFLLPNSMGFEQRNASIP